MTTYNTPYEALGEAGIRQLVARFYDLMDELPAAAGIRQMHAEDLSPVKEKLTEYLVGWMGGPPLYAEKYGGVCMTTPHEPYAIGPAERDQWLLCMNQAMDQVGLSDELKTMLEAPLYQVADMVRNRD